MSSRPFKPQKYSYHRLTRLITYAYSLMSGPTGRSHEASWQRGRMRCPRAGKTHSPHSGGPGLRPGALRPPARSWLTAASLKRALAESAVPGADKTPRWSAAGRASSAKGRRTARCELKMVASRGAPSPSTLRRGKGIRANPAPGKEYGRRSIGFLRLILRSPPKRERRWTSRRMSGLMVRAASAALLTMRREGGAIFTPSALAALATGL
jgi:hypothetical protein